LLAGTWHCGYDRKPRNPGTIERADPRLSVPCVSPSIRQKSLGLNSRQKSVLLGRPPGIGGRSRVGSSLSFCAEEYQNNGCRMPWLQCTTERINRVLLQKTVALIGQLLSTKGRVVNDLLEQALGHRTEGHASYDLSHNN
jgi:hypothetical protein